MTKIDIDALELDETSYDSPHFMASEELLDLLQTDGVVEEDEFFALFRAMYQLAPDAHIDDNAAVEKIGEVFSMELEFDEGRVYLIDYVVDPDADEDTLTGVHYGC